MLEFGTESKSREAAESGTESVTVRVVESAVGVCTRSVTGRMVGHGAVVLTLVTTGQMEESSEGL